MSWQQLGGENNRERLPCHAGPEGGMAVKGLAVLLLGAHVLLARADNGESPRGCRFPAEAGCVSTVGFRSGGMEGAAGSRVVGPGRRRRRGKWGKRRIAKGKRRRRVRLGKAKLKMEHRRKSFLVFC